MNIREADEPAVSGEMLGNRAPDARAPSRPVASAMPTAGLITTDNESDFDSTSRIECKATMSFVRSSARIRASVSEGRSSAFKTGV